MASASVAQHSPRLLRLDHCMGDCHDNPAVVERDAVATGSAVARGCLQCGEANGGIGADALNADVARGVSFSGRGVVSDVAIAHLEWAGGGVPHVRGGGGGTAAPAAAGYRWAAVDSIQM